MDSYTHLRKRKQSVSFVFRSCRLAQTDPGDSVLRIRNVCRGDKVLIHLRRGFAILEWMLAVLKCGAAFVYLDPDFTEHQRTAVMQNCKPSLVVDEALAQVAATADLDTPAEADDSLDEAKYGTADEDLAYMIYTSGSPASQKAS